MKRNVLIVCGLLVVLSLNGAAKAKFKSTWKAPGVTGLNYGGRKIVGLIVSDDMPLRISTEEALASALTARGAEGVAAYRLIPKEEIRDRDNVRRWFTQSNTAAVVMMRLVDLSKERIPTEVLWTGGGYYGSLWNYYPYAWGSTYSIIPGRVDTRVVVETMVFDVNGDHPLWAGTSESVNPKDARQVVTDIVESAADRMRKDGLIRGK